MIERGVHGSSVVLARTGRYVEDQPDGLFTGVADVSGNDVTANVVRPGEGPKL